jgi:hypothetical protein
VSKGSRNPREGPSSPTPIHHTKEALADEVVDLPGLDVPPPSRSFSGYLPISDSKRIFYW